MASSWPWLILAMIGYSVLVRFLRYRRRDQVPLRFGYQDRASWPHMTLNDAHVIQLSLAEFEFPTVFSVSVFFALFKTYGIPSISQLLVATGHLSSPLTASKRAADTGVIITEVVLNAPDSVRTIDGISRMNFLHGKYIQSSKISNDDMLYTLSLFVLEPLRWTEKFEWRRVTDVERCAMGVYWRDLGEAMNIHYEPLVSSPSNKEPRWRDGLHWLEELERWSLAYEKEKMVPDEANAKLARATFDIGLFNLPQWMKPFGYKIASCLLEPRLRRAMLLDDPSKVYAHILTALISIRKFLLLHFFLPRPSFMRVKWFTNADPQTGRFNFLRYTAHPWYIKPTLFARWGWQAWLLRLVGGAIPGDKTYFPEGYRISELGPRVFVGKGEEEMERTRREVGERRGCVFARS